MTNVLNGGWVPQEDRMIHVHLKVSESLARDANPEALARLLGDDAMQRVRELLAEDDLKRSKEKDDGA